MAGLTDALNPWTDSLTGRRPQSRPHVGPIEPTVANRFADWLASLGMPRWQANRIGQVAPWTPPGAAFQGGQDIARGYQEGSPATALWGAGQIGAAALPLAYRASPRPSNGLSFTPHDIHRWLQDAGARKPRVNQPGGGTSYVEFGNVGNRGEQWQVRVPADAHAQLAGPYPQHWDRMLDTGTVSRSTGAPVRTPRTHNAQGQPYADWDVLTQQLSEIINSNRIARARRRPQ